MASAAPAPAEPGNSPRLDPNPDPACSAARSARFPQDVPSIAILLDLCFAGVLDYSSRVMLRDIRALAMMGVLAWRVAERIGMIQSDEWKLASVWDEAGKIAGNVTITRRRGERDAWLIANVAVHPDSRRRGIARAMVRHALGMIRARGGRSVYLQVDAANESAVRMYREIGFSEIGGRTSWLRGREERKSPSSEETPAPAWSFAQRKASEWADEFGLWKEVSPHGEAWNTPLSERVFRPSPWRSLEWLTSGEQEKHFIARCSGRVEAALSAYSRASGWEGVLIQREGTQGKVEAELLESAWKFFPRDQNLLLETMPEASVEILVQLGFQKRRTFRWMRYTFDGGGS
jgi:ribosomal protein S18 acetylase RimI-like enzyme